MFPCKRCGNCCRMIGHISWAKHMALPDGVCRYLDQQTNLCSIYENRPVFCNVDAYYQLYMKGKMDKDEFYALNEKECNTIREKYIKER